mmetsp:Transcript_37020/g.72810  ORF Transcript_37020/g.72810 Transcript_37020/m.72810 type:complete len:242 (-) Transcript_37020:48-773(-)
MNLDKKEFVVQFLHLPLELRQKRKRLLKLFVLQKQRCQFRFDSESKEGSLLLFTPLDAVLAEFHLESDRVGNLLGHVDDRAHNFGCSCLGKLCEKRSDFGHQVFQSLRISFLNKQLSQRIDALLLDLYIFSRVVSGVRVQDPSQFGLRSHWIGAAKVERSFKALTQISQCHGSLLALPHLLILVSSATLPKENESSALQFLRPSNFLFLSDRRLLTRWRIHSRSVARRIEARRQLPNKPTL